MSAANKNNTTILALPALGNTIEPGMLWNGSEYKTYAGQSLWDKADIEKKQIVNEKPTSSFKFQYSSDERKNAFNLDAEASLSVSFGLFKVEGSAKYLKEEKLSTHEVIISATSEVETQTRYIPQEVLANIKYGNNLDLPGVTHYVASVTEGGRAAMLFRYAASSKEEKEKIQGELALEVKAALCIQGEAKVDMKRSDTVNQTNIQSEFFGDYALKNSIADFNSALTEAKQFPLRLKGATRTLSFELVPIGNLDSVGFRLYRTISEDTVNDVKRAYEKHQDMTLKLKCLQDQINESEACKCLKVLKQQVTNFCNSFSSCVVKFREEVTVLLPKIKGGTCDEEIQSRNQLNAAISPVDYQAKIAEQFWEKKQSEIHTIQKYIDNQLVKNGYKVQVSALPVRVKNEKKSCLLVDLNSIDQEEEVHPLESALLKGVQQQRSSTSDWWGDQDIVSDLDSAFQKKVANDKSNLKCDYWIGVKKPSQSSQEGKQPGLLYTHDCNTWVPWHPPPHQFCCGEINFREMNIGEGREQVEISAFVQFPFEFEEAPEVTIGFAYLDLVKNSDVNNPISAANFGVTASIEFVAKDNFRMKCSTVDWSIIRQVRVSWFACSPDLVNGMGVFTFDLITKQNQTLKFLTEGNPGQLGCVISSLHSRKKFLFSERQNRNMRLRTNIKSATNSIEISSATWADSIMSKNKVSWFLLKNECKHIVQSGKIHVPFKDKMTGFAKTDVIVTFEMPFTKVPNVVLMLSAVDVNGDANARVQVIAKDIRTAAMTVEVTKWADTKLYFVDVTWIAGIQG